MTQILGFVVIPLENPDLSGFGSRLETRVGDAVDNASALLVPKRSTITWDRETNGLGSSHAHPSKPRSFVPIRRGADALQGETGISNNRRTWREDGSSTDFLIHLFSGTANGAYR